MSIQGAVGALSMPSSAHAGYTASATVLMPAGSPGTPHRQPDRKRSPGLNAFCGG